jgi:HPt (histidine-containing phosphotransfer) domain-containing protein
MSLSRKWKSMNSATEQSPEVFDEALALSSVGGDTDYLAEVIGLVQAAWPALLANIREAMARADFRAVASQARLAKAAARNVSAHRAYESALHLETMAGKGDFSAVLEASANLEREVKRLQLPLARRGGSSSTL